MGIINGTAFQGGGNTYNFTDNITVSGATYYRIKIVEGNAYKLSKVVLLNNKPNEFSIKSLINPFSGTLSFDLISPSAGTANISIIDNYGRLLKNTKETVSPGINNYSLTGFEGLSQGAYTLRVQMGSYLINKQVIKWNH